MRVGWEASNLIVNQESIASGFAQALIDGQKEEIAFLRKLTED